MMSKIKGLLIVGPHDRLESITLRADSRKHYRDEVCISIEEVLRTRPKYDGWTVHRLKVVGDPEYHGPLDVRDVNGNQMTRIFDDEIKLLDTPELLLAYIGGNTNRDIIANRVDRRHSVIVLLGLIPFLLFSFITIFGLELLSSIILNFVAGLVCFAPMYISWRMRNRALIDADKSSAQANPYFREAIQRLATFAENQQMKEYEFYIDRHEALEKALFENE